MPLTILEIAEKINKDLQNNKKITAMMLNQILIDEGDLADTAIGKVETSKGRKNGIKGEFRIENECWVPLYNEQAAQYIIELAENKLINMNEENKDKDDKIVYHCSQGYYREMSRLYRNRIILLEAEYYYRTYDESAKWLGRILKIEKLPSIRGKKVLTIRKNDIDEVIDRLEKQNIGCVICHSDEVEVLIPEEDFKLSVGSNMKIRLKDSSGEISDMYLSEGNLRTEFEVDNMGIVSLITKDLNKSDIAIIRQGTAMWDAVMGKAVSDSLICEGKEYTVENIEV